MTFAEVVLGLRVGLTSTLLLSRLAIGTVRKHTHKVHISNHKAKYYLDKWSNRNTRMCTNLTYNILVVWTQEKIDIMALVLMAGPG